MSPRNSQADTARSVEREFVLEYYGAEQVYICGDFNDWQPASLRMIGARETGLWEKRLALPPGRYEYKFVVDGNWLHDPDASENVVNIHGSLNSVVEVRPRPKRAVNRASADHHSEIVAAARPSRVSPANARLTLQISTPAHNNPK